MKKCVRIVLIIGVIWFSLNFIETEAKIFYDNPKLNLCAKLLNTKDEFNVLTGYTDNQELKESWFLTAYYDFIDGYLENGEMYLEGTITGDSGSAQLKTTFQVEDYVLKKYQAAIGDKVFFEFIMENGSPNITICEEVDLNKILGYSYHNFKLYSDYSVYYDREDAVEENLIPDSQDVEYMGFGSIYSMIYQYNQVYEGQEVHFVTECTNPITLEEIINSLEVTDLTENEVSVIEIMDSDYEIKNNFVIPGDYEFTILARDSYGNTSLQPCKINVVDITPPVITGVNKTVSYIIKTPESILLNYFTATDESGVESIRIIRNEYDTNSNIPGSYVVEAEAVDIYGNSATASILITVIDDRAPIMTIERNVVISTLDDYELYDFKKFIKVYDTCDGDIEEYRIIDSSDYLNQKKKTGKYEFAVEASDKSGNLICSKLVVQVVDKDFPQIHANAYTIIVREGTEITREQIIELLSKVGQVDTLEDVTMSSDYFEEEHPSGSYDLMVKTSDDRFYDNQIQVVKKGEYGFNYEIPKIESENKNRIYFIIGGILLGGVFLCGGLGIVIWKKRH